MRPPRILLLLSCALVGATAIPAARSADDPYASLLAPSGVCGAAADELTLDRAAAQQAMTCLTNYARSRSGLEPLRPSSILSDAGQAKLAADLSCAEFSHTPCGTPFTDVFAAYVAGATSYTLGENIAWGTGTYGTPREAMNGWLHSSGHRENILRAGYRELGIGYLADQTFQGYEGASLWSQEFGARTPKAAATPASAQPASAPAATKPVLRRKAHPHRKRRHLRR
jgi:uncharacterized protein YkwD